uniref:Uncharacterized protein n=1 Tax=Meloidogyne incognita TaxID=6306 RepID=A0A914KX33_MELIC
MVQEAEKYRGEDEIQRDCVSAKNGLTSSRQWRMIRWCHNKYSSYMCGRWLCNINSYTETLLRVVFKMSNGLQQIDDDKDERS